MSTAPRRICVLTDCQMEGLVAALQILLPESEVYGFHSYRLRGPEAEAVVARVRESDLLLIKPLAGKYGALRADNVRALHPRVRFVPQVVFPAFHPDLTYLPKGEEAFVQSPLTDYNSIIAVSGFLLGLGVARTVALYNAFVYRKLGYFDLLARCEAELVETFARHGIDLAAMVARWSAGPDCFMYSTNHPRAHVLADVALAVCRAEGLAVPDRFPCPDLMPDKLATWVIYPVFPEIAERLGKQGHYCFKALSFDRMNVLGLDAFVERSFAAYAAEDRAAWAPPARLARCCEQITQLVR